MLSYVAASITIYTDRLQKIEDAENLLNNVAEEQYIRETPFIFPLVCVLNFD